MSDCNKGLLRATTMACCFLVTAAARAADGTGLVFVPNTVNDPTLHVVSLPNLDGSGFLRGEAVDVTNGFDAMERAFNATLVFNYDPTQPGEQRVHFAETMAYYHIAAFDEYISLLGFGVTAAPVRAVVFAHVPLETLCIPMSTEYDPATQVVNLTATVECDESDAFDGDVIVHEYAHAVQHRLLGGEPGVFVALQTDASEQALALMEAFADFAAASRFNDSRLGEWSAMIWSDSPFARDVDNFRRWPGDLKVNQAHSTGLIFAGALWDLRCVVGVEVVERLWLQAMPLLEDGDLESPELNTTFDFALDTILEADAQLYGAAHQARIRQAFAAHGIGDHDFSTPFPMVRDPGNDYDDLEVYIDNSEGTAALLVAFDEFVTKLEGSCYTTDEFPRVGVDEKSTTDQLTILDAGDAVVGAFSGRDLQGASILIPGNAVKLHLTTDSYLPPFGYRVVDIVPVGLGDFDTDGDVDVSDFAGLCGCVGDPGRARAPECVIGDYDRDGDVDLADFASFQAELGPGLGLP